MASVPINASDHELTTTRFLASLVTSQRKIEVFSSQLCGSSIWMQISAVRAIPGPLAAIPDQAG